MRRRLALLALVMLALAPVRPARATLHEIPVQFRVLDTVERDGARLRGTIEVRALKTTVFEARGLSQSRGRARFAQRPASRPLVEGSTVRVPFEADAGAGAGLVLLEYTCDGDDGRWLLDPAELETAGRPRAAKQRRAAPGSAPLPEPTADELAMTVRARPAVATPAITVPGERDIRVYGSLKYDRPTATGGSVELPVEGVTVKIYDNDYPILTYLLSTETDANGNFDVTWHWVPINPFDTDPDLTLEFVVQNSHFTLRTPSGLFVYSELTGTMNNVGTSANFGEYSATDERTMQSHDILTNLMRTRRWFADQGWNMGHVSVIWPEPFDDVFGSGSWYSSLENAIHLGRDRAWHAPTAIHEYGHFFISQYGSMLTPDYCNGVCDGVPAPVPTPWACGHCRWCTETDHDAWNEGIANAIAEYVTNLYSLYAVYVYDAEGVATCDATGGYGDPLRTEGHLQALIRDMTDPADPGEITAGAGDFRDLTQLPFVRMLQVADWDNPVTTQQFVDRYRARFPADRRSLYWCMRMAGFAASDVTPPTQPGVIALTGGRSFGFPSPDRTIFFNWIAASDLDAGVDTYHIGISTTPVAPGGAGTIYHWWQEGDSLSDHYTLPSSGTYYINVTAIDHEGNEGPVRSSGSVIVGNPDPAQLTSSLGIGWADVTVARGAADAGLNSVPLPTSILPGFATNTYWNFSARNVGGATTTDSVTAGLLLDGAIVRSYTWRPILANEPFGRINEGPVYVRGGRHAFVSMLDHTHRLAESNESDNLFGRQFVWSPFNLVANTAYVAVAPPPAAAWDGLGGAFWYNATGERMSAPSGSWWNLTWVAGGSSTTDYDCRLHFPTTSADTGFGASRGYSGRGPGCLDAVLANKNTVGSGSWDVGVLNRTGQTATFVVKHVTSASFTFDDSVAFTMPSGEYAIVRELYVGAAQLGPVSVVVDGAAGAGKLYVAWYDRTFTTGGLLDGVVGTSDANGRARVDVNVNTAGYYGVVIWRDPKDGSSALPLRIEMGTTPPDLIPYAMAGWHSPFVPRPRHDGTPSSVPLPDTLYGDSTATALNLALRNESAGGGGAFQAQFDLDGVATWWLNVGAFGGWATSGLNDPGNFNVRGGRHTLVARYDQPNRVEEIREDNNTFGEQYVWGPKGAAMESGFLRSNPPDRTGGWDAVSTGEALYYNCDGWRTPRFAASGNDGWWGAVVSIPFGDVDLRLHEVAQGAKTGFGANLATSAWGLYESDFAIVNFNRTPFRAFDVGQLSTPTGAWYYLAEAVKSRWLASSPAGLYGPYTFDSNTLLKLHEVYLPAGSYVVELVSDAGQIDWGLSLYGTTGATYGKSDALGASWGAPQGVDEAFAVTVPTAGYHAVAVWRVGVGGSNDGTYRLRFRSATTDAPGAPHVAATRLAVPRPNPFAGAADLSFTLATEGDVMLAVYDLRGARVRTLASGRRGTGEHAIRWDGRDEDGRAVAPGVYLVRLDAGAAHDVAKLVRME
ncbi:MAG: hypothetical protein HZA61_03775 [Candidatus Eisenbacteria bacterium]|uniref:FlgD/Vpr Ig-like domain-containing protein n=1 Tax=Eiseniibacteriota bacterium TaxID=2212470 RepID=A0A933S9S5_UNCEI|nr:hypothetical protein [Candidatus Eisenbacteria bacterium]